MRRIFIICAISALFAVAFAHGVGDAVAQAAQGAAQGASQSVAEPQVFGPAPVQAPEQQTFLGSLLNMAPLIAVCYLIFYFMVMKPQEAKAKSHKTLVDSLKKGETVVTSGGLVGKIAGTEKEYVVLEISPNVKVKVEQAHVVKRVGDEDKAQAA